ncbi:MAG: MerR family transcriptional regulator [Pararhodobacter sp.]
MKKAPEAFRTISEVADLLETPAHVLRFWESKFYQIRPVKRAGGRRYYRPDDVALIAGIKHLLQDRGMTIRGVQKVLQEQGVRHVMRLAPPVAMDEGDEDAVLSFPAGAADTPDDTAAPVATADTVKGADTPIPPSAPKALPAPPARVSATVSRLPVSPPRFRPDGADDAPRQDRPHADSVPAAPEQPQDPARDQMQPPQEAPVSDTPDRAHPAPATDASAPQVDMPGAAVPAMPDADTPDAGMPLQETAPSGPVPPGGQPAAARLAPTEAPAEQAPVAGSPVAQATVADRPARLLRRIPRGAVGARAGQFGLLARRMDALLDRMSEASGAGRW